MKDILNLVSKIFSFVLGLVMSFFRIKQNRKINDKNDQVLKNEIKKVAKNAESKNPEIKQKAIDDMRRLISD